MKKKYYTVFFIDEFGAKCSNKVKATDKYDAKWLTVFEHAINFSQIIEVHEHTLSDDQAQRSPRTTGTK